MDKSRRNAYFNNQFLKAVELFGSSNKEILLHIQADASLSCDKINNLIDDSIMYYKKYTWGLYAPNVYFTSFVKNITNTFTFEEKNLKTVSVTDCTFWFIHKDIIRSVFNLNINFTKYKFGWGYDILCSSICNLLNRPIIRDYNYLVAHPKGTGYNKIFAMAELEEIIMNLPEDIKNNYRKNILVWFATQK